MEGEQNWYPISRVGWFTEHVRDGIEVTRGQIELFGPALAEPYRLDDATVERAKRAYDNQRGDLELFRNQADRWVREASTPTEQAALERYVAAIDELAALTDEVLGICAQLSQHTIEKLMAKSDYEVGLEALMRLVGDLPR